MKNNILKLFTALIILSVWNTISYANFSDLNTNWVSTKIESIFEKYTQQLEKKYWKNTAIKKIESLWEKLYTYQDSQYLSGDKKNIIDSLEKLSNEYVFTEKYNQQKISNTLKLSSYDNSELFKNKVINSDTIFLENWIWYTYVFIDHLTFENWVKPTLRDYQFNNILPNEDLFFITKEGKPWYAQDFEKVRLIPNRILYGIPNKNNILRELRDDKFYLHTKNSDITLLEIKNISQKLKSESKNREQFIEKIYDYVLKNTQYTENIDLNDKEIFSWLETFENNSWVCEWYTKLFQYLAQFWWIKDVETIRWYVVDAQDYPEIWHAWIKIGDKYYDPTFDDPIWSINDREREEYYYFWLPKDLFYTNRYEYNNSNEVLEKSPLEFRKQWIKKNLIAIFPKYKWKGYKLLEELEFKDKYNIDFQSNITIEILFNNVDFIEVDNFQNITDNKTIQTLQYYDVSSNTNISSLLRQINYDFETYTLIKWKDNNSTIYRIGFNIKYN